MGKGQAAMEFIMTYGWAIIALLVMIGALAYFGVLSPGKYLPEKCLFGPGISCKDYQIKHNGGNLQLLLTIENKMGDAIVLQGVNVTTVGGTTYTSTCAGFPTTTLDNDGAAALTCNMGASTSPGVGQQAKFNVIITYINIRGTYNHSVSGEVQSKVQS
jgi:hypothetical protein